jgi:hypothetical protein
MKSPAVILLTRRALSPGRGGLLPAWRLEWKAEQPLSVHEGTPVARKPTGIEVALNRLCCIPPTSSQNLATAVKAVADELAKLGDKRASDVRRLRLERLPGRYEVRSFSGDEVRPFTYQIGNRNEQQRMHRHATRFLGFYVRALLGVDCPVCLSLHPVPCPLGYPFTTAFGCWVYRPWNLAWPEIVVRLAEAMRAKKKCCFALHDALVECGQADLAACTGEDAAGREYLLDFILDTREGLKVHHYRLKNRSRWPRKAPRIVSHR